MGLAALYGVAAALAVWFRPRAKKPAAGYCPPVTVLKPLCGEDAELEACLASVCAQDYPVFQIVFGVADAGDPALAAAERVRARFPDVAIDIVIDDRVHGANRKVSNLINIMARARYDTLVVADSDIRVGRDYLAGVTAPLDDPATGLVTCLYRAGATRDRWSRCHAMFIDEWFAPMVLIAQRLGFGGFAFGATMAMRRPTLAAIGGFAAVADQLADDYALGAKIRSAGLATVLADYVVETVVDEPRLARMRTRELRWMRTLRTLTPVSYLFSAVSLTLALSLVAVALGFERPSVWGLAAVALAARVILHYRQAGRDAVRGLWLLPVRDALLCYAWLRGFDNRRISWRGRDFCITGHGTLSPPDAARRAARGGPDH